MIAGELDNDEIATYIKLCDSKRDFHLQNSISASKWFGFFNFLNVLLTSGCALSMTILTVLKSSDIEITVIGAVFAFSSAITSQIQKNYGFEILNYRHGELSNQFQELSNAFQILSRKVHSTDDFEKLTLRYLSVNSRTNIVSVRKCVDFFICWN